MANGDKRSVSTDALETLGTIIGEGAGRDAIHLAVEPVVAAETLTAGTHVGFVTGGVGITGCSQFLGIVDPFLRAVVQKGERFWLVVYPRQITSLRHVWSHPEFPEAGVPIPVADKEASEEWLENFCSTHDCPDWSMVREVITSRNGVQLSDERYYGASRIEGDYVMFWGVDAHSDIPNEFWDHAEIVTGQKFTQRPTHFSCSC